MTKHFSRGGRDTCKPERLYGRTAQSAWHSPELAPNCGVHRLTALWVTLLWLWHHGPFAPQACGQQPQ